MFKEEQLPRQETKSEDKPEEKLLCRQCHNPITSKSQAMEINKKHQHTFFNPAGLLFEISCFKDARGCIVAGDPTSEFSWFSGFAWQYATCNQCLTHLGWYYKSSSETGFFGLIVNRLIDEK